MNEALRNVNMTYGERSFSLRNVFCSCLIVVDIYHQTATAAQ